jgi:hypothetical protein
LVRVAWHSSIATLLNFYSWILKQLRIRQFEFDDQFTDEQIDEGRELLRYGMF